MNDWWTNSSEYVQENGAAWASSILLGLVIMVIGWALARVAASATGRALRRTKALSLAPMTSTLVKLTLTVTTIVMALDQVGLDVTAVLAGAGVIGLAVGFGAQTLVKDCISGFFLVVEEVIEPGDWVEMNGKFGQVENVGLRMTQLRSFDGTLWYIPNGEVTLVGNRSSEWARAIVEVGVAYEADLERALEVLQSVGDDFADANPELLHQGERPLAQGALSFGDSSVGLRLVVKMRHGHEGDVWPTERDLRREVKAAFDREGIEIPFPRRVVYTRGADGPDGAGEAKAA